MTFTSSQRMPLYWLQAHVSAQGHRNWERIPDGTCQCTRTTWASHGAAEAAECFHK